MSSHIRVFASRFALGTALVASACQHDSNVIFDDGALKSPDTGGSGATDNGGTDAAAGADTGGSSSSGSGGSTNQGGKATAGEAGRGQAGKATGGGGGKAGSDAGGSTSQGGKIGQGGKAGSANAGGGVGGSSTPEPVTVETTEIADTDVSSCAVGNRGEAVSMTVGGGPACNYEILINAPLTIVPDGAIVSAATLTLTCTDPGGPIMVSYVNEAWDELNVRWNNRPNMGMMIDTVTCDPAGEITIDLTSAVRAWLAGDHKPNGIYLHSESSDGTDFDTSESEDVGARPKLSITYTVPPK